jgi:hypothetical protein
VVGLGMAALGFAALGWLLFVATTVRLYALSVN